MALPLFYSPVRIRDRHYIDGRTFWGDLRIIAATVLGGGSGDAVTG
jgi:lipopolysaccharide/colanic/teichoic acid biosynthesis glycosyltransferase